MLENVDPRLLMAERSMFMSRIQEVTRTYPCQIQEYGPTQLTDYLYIGGYTDAKDVLKLEELGINHVLNCAAFRRSSKNPYPPECGVISYKQFEAVDDDNYDITQHFPEAADFINQARHMEGKVLVHCARGINRSGAICIAYLMLDNQWDLVQTVRFVKEKRGLILTNGGFQRQLIDFARKYDVLYSSEDSNSA